MENEFDDIYRRYGDDLYRFILKMTQDEQIALDILQETFLKAALHFDRFRGECAVKTWLCSIARNEYCTWLKKNGNENKERFLEVLAVRRGLGPWEAECPMPVP